VGGNNFGDRVFWTTAIPDKDVQVNPGAERAELHIHDLALKDYPKIPVALGPNFQTASVPATISIDAVWDGPVTRRVNVRDGTNGDHFAGQFTENQVTVSWSASNASGFRFTGNPGTLSTTTIPGFAFSEVGHVMSGIFFPGDQEEDDANVAGQQGDSGAAASPAPEQALAALMLPGANSAFLPAQTSPALGGTDLVPGDGRSPFVGGPLQSQPTGALNTGPALNLAGVTTAVDSPTGDRGPGITSDPVAASDALFTEAGRSGADFFAR
jgi:hypothetical protein